MAVDRTIAQALVIVDAQGPSLVARSADFPFAWEEAALTMAVRFGRRPPGIACPGAVCALPVGQNHVTIIQVADLNPAISSPSATDPIGFRFLMLNRTLYEILNDPFAIAERFPPRWADRGVLDSLSWNGDNLPVRTVAAIAESLKTGDSALLLGSVQAVIDGGRVLIESPEPDEQLVRALWQLIPTRSRIDIWPATFTFSVELGFHFAVTPVRPEPWPFGALTADQARDYPEGRYELALQIAAEANDQHELDRLLARRSSNETLRLAAYILAFAIFAVVIGKLL